MTSGRAPRPGYREVVPGERSFAPYAAATATRWDERAGGQRWVVAHGSLAKVDLSGFTRLSERLARSERTGAETLNAVLTDVFTELIEEVLCRGGDVLQFGGDALLIWFEGPEHAVRAAAACRGMQRRLAGRPAEQTPAGTVRLRMSAAVASGPLVLAVQGEDHRELLSFGPVASRVEQVEKHASSGELLVDPATAAAVPDRWLRPRPDSLVRVIGVPDHAPAHRTPAGGDGAAAFVPPDVRTLERLGVPVGEHRRTAVAFVGLPGLDALVAGGDIACAVDRVATVTAAVDEAVASIHVAWTAVDVMADGVVHLLFAGAPVARENDEERMVRACRLIADRCAGLGVRIGANVGRVFAADIGHPERRTFAAIGDTTNLAARLMHRAAPGEVLVSADLVEASHDDHEVDWLEPFPVKGLRRQVRAGRLGARRERSTTGRRRTHDLPLVGREDEQTRLRRLVSSVAGDGAAAALLALVGDAGAGKSRLVEDTVQYAVTRGVAVIRATATPFDVDAPYAPLRAALREMLGVEDDEDAAAALSDIVPDRAMIGLLGPPLGLDLPASAAAEALDARFVEARRHTVLADALVAAAPRRGPLLLVVEDLHWLDRASRGALRELANRLRGQTAAPLGLLFASRVEPARLWEGGEDVPTVPLTPLSPQAGERLVLAALGERAVSDAALQRLVADGAGNPLFLRELAALGAVGEEVPGSAEEVIAARIDELGPARRRLLRDCAVGGSVQPLDDVVRLLDDPALATTPAWEGLADFVAVEDDPAGGRRLRFHHELHRQVAYAGLAVRRRRELHGRLADLQLPRVARGTGAAATLASHLHQAHRFEEAWRWSVHAAEEAQRASALQDAAALYARAVDAGRRAGMAGDVLADVLEHEADVAELVGEYTRAGASLRLAARTGEAAVVARRRVKRAVVLERQGRYRAALGELTRAEHLLDRAGAPAADVRTALALRRSSVLHRLGRLAKAYAVAEGVAAAVTSAASYQQRADRARALLRMEMIASEAGYPQRFELGATALAAFEGLDEDRDLAYLLGNIGVTLLDAGDWRAAQRRFDEAIEVYRRAGDVVGAALVEQNAGEILCEQGHLDRAADVFARARRVFRAAGHDWGSACTASALGRVEARRGRHDIAAALLDEAVAELEALGSAVFVADARARQVELALLRDAATALGPAESLAAGLGAIEAGQVLPLTVRRYVACAAAAAGDLPRAEALAHDVAARARHEQVAHEESMALDLLAQVVASRGDVPDRGVLARRDVLWRELGVIWTPTYLSLS